MKPTDVEPLPCGTPMIDPDTQETWIVAYCEAIAQSDPFGPFAYGLVNDESDERIVFHARVLIDRNPAVILPRHAPSPAA